MTIRPDVGYERPELVPFDPAISLIERVYRVIAPIVGEKSTLFSTQRRPAVPPETPEHGCDPVGHRTDSHDVTGIPRWSLIASP